LLGSLVALLLVPLTACTTTPSEAPAVDALVQMYDQPSGSWPTTGWWNNANAMTALTDYMIQTDDHRYEWILQNTFAQKRFAFDGNFVNDLTDDTGWWALAWIRAYDLTGNSAYLNTARIGVDAMWSRQDNVCGGGLWWTTARTYKNAISNELFVQAAAELAKRLPSGGDVYRDRALSVWSWFQGSGMINDDLLINDGLNSACHNNGETVWTYNQGVVLGALVALRDLTGSEYYVRLARALGSASSASKVLHVDNVLTEPCEKSGCSIDGPSFKGIYVRNLGLLNRALDDHPYTDYLVAQATVAADNDRTDDAEYGLHWAGPIVGISGATQQSAVDLLVASRPPATADATPTTEDVG
jgi:predicted alpha-1,6-mannanase (GH76 family)